MDYVLKHKDKLLVMFRLTQEVEMAIISKKYKEWLPLPLKRIINFSEEFIDGEMNDINYYIVNPEGCWLIEAWLNDREIPLDRENVEKYLQHGETARKLMLDNYAFSFTDCYWIQAMKEIYDNKELTWDEVKAKSSESVDTLRVVLQGKNRMYKGVNATLGGSLEKFWYYSNEDERTTLKICKKTERYYDVLNAREVIASLIYKMQGYENYCNYNYVYASDESIAGCRCEAFTSENIELITAYDLLEEINRTQADNVYELIVEQAVNYGANYDEVVKYMDLQTIVDYLILNRDRHQCNIGFLRDANTLKIIKPAPVYDSGSSKYYEEQPPEGITGTVINGLYNTEDECLKHVKHWDVIDLEKLPSISDIKKEYDKCTNIKEERKQQLLKLYEGKIKHIEEIQKDVGSK